ncbi:3-methyladenine DNA glycosylase Tag [Lachnospiraceae bacterium PF1-21]
MSEKKERCGWAGEDELYCRYHDEVLISCLTRVRTFFVYIPFYIRLSI